MTLPKPEVDNAQIVLRGSFNPAILHPAWLVARGLIEQGAGDAAEVAVVSRQVAEVGLEWCSYRATTDFFEADSGDASRYPFLSELVTGIFTCLDSTPLRMMGLNRRMHFGIGSEAGWHALGDSLAPKGPWKGALSGPRDGGLPGLLSLTMEGSREGSEARYLRVKVEPSVKVRPGIYVETNEHYEIADDEPSSRLLAFLKSSWADALNYALDVAQRLVSREVD